MAATSLVTARSEIVFAGFFRRVFAYLVDAALLIVVGAAVAIIGLYLYGYGLPAIANASLVSGAIGWAYFALLESSPAQGSVGKITFDIFVADIHGDPIGFWRASARYWLKSLSSLLLMLGWIMPAFTPRKQALHDMLAGTLVLRRVRYVVAGEEPPTDPGDYWDGSRWVANVARSISVDEA